VIDGYRCDFVFHRERHVTVVEKDRWTFTPKGRLQFLQRWAWKLLLKTGGISNFIGERVEYRRINFDGKSALDKIMSARSATFEMHRDPAHLLIGAETFAEIMGDPAMRDMAMCASGPSFKGEMGFGRRIFDLPVTVVPWMQGLVLLDERMKREVAAA
jgi:hypothetical protein